MAALAKLRRAGSGVCARIERSWSRRLFFPAHRARRHEVEPLEKRQLLSVAANISGPSSVTEGDAYVLSLTATSTDPSFVVNNWIISYGDGTTHTLSGDAASDQYAYNTPGSPHLRHHRHRRGHRGGRQLQRQRHHARRSGRGDRLALSLGRICRRRGPGV